jgi:hypothetical protein
VLLCDGGSIPKIRFGALDGREGASRHTMPVTNNNPYQHDTDHRTPREGARRPQLISCARATEVHTHTEAPPPRALPTAARLHARYSTNRAALLSKPCLLHASIWRPRTLRQYESLRPSGKSILIESLVHDTSLRNARRIRLQQLLKPTVADSLTYDHWLYRRVVGVYLSVLSADRPMGRYPRDAPSGAKIARLIAALAGDLDLSADHCEIYYVGMKTTDARGESEASMQVLLAVLDARLTDASTMRQHSLVRAIGVRLKEDATRSVLRYSDGHFCHPKYIVSKNDPKATRYRLILNFCVCSQVKVTKEITYNSIVKM